MRFFGRIVIALLANSAAVLISTYTIEGFSVAEGPIALLAVAGLLTLLNIFVRPLVKFFLSPLIVLTLGLFSLAINAALLFLLDFYSESLTINGLIPLFYATALISAVNILVHFAARRIR